MKNILTYLSLLILFVLSATIGHSIEIMKVMPNMILVFVVCYSMYGEPVKSTVLAVVAGSVMDLFYAKNLGINAIMMMYTALLISYLCSNYIRTNFIMVVVFVFLSSILYEGLYSFFLYFIFDKISFTNMFVIIIKEALYNMFLSFILIWPAKYLSHNEVRSF